MTRSATRKRRRYWVRPVQGTTGTHVPCSDLCMHTSRASRWTTLGQRPSTQKPAMGATLPDATISALCTRMEGASHYGLFPGRSPIRQGL